MIPMNNIRLTKNKFRLINMFLLCSHDFIVFNFAKPKVVKNSPKI